MFWALFCIALAQLVAANCRLVFHWLTVWIGHEHLKPWTSIQRLEIKVGLALAFSFCFRWKSIRLFAIVNKCGMSGDWTGRLTVRPFTAHCVVNCQRSAQGKKIGDNSHVYKTVQRARGIFSLICNDFEYATNVWSAACIFQTFTALLSFVSIPPSYSHINNGGLR